MLFVSNDGFSSRFTPHGTLLWDFTPWLPCEAINGGRIDSASNVIPSKNVRRRRRVSKMSWAKWTMMAEIDCFLWLAEIE